MSVPLTNVCFLLDNSTIPTHWQAPITFNPNDYEGFIYCITNKLTGRRYIGRKTFHFNIKLKPLKGRKNKRHRKKPSDWPTYTSSSVELNSDILRSGKENFEFVIIHLCENKSQLAYYEPYYMYKYEVLTAGTDGKRQYYNKVIPPCKSIPKGIGVSLNVDCSSKLR